MPFGKHKGARLDEVPSSYFSWALQNMTDLDSDLRIAMQEQAATRNEG
ncbi:putative quorum-sensing-regulated virulence factor [Alicyclobacillus fodiniaquatilis]|uniref:Quorum-sensing-regulated virulence factor n=1 Tax=Alicyclobacillus fodiniaquatilis TaxID=1661150 RepID=A0ABW4JLQ1_9BACL